MLTKSKPDILATACPLCKKSFVHGNKVKVHDIAEIVAQNIVEKTTIKQKMLTKKLEELEINSN
jgi:hypothetical protein